MLGGSHDQAMNPVADDLVQVAVGAAPSPVDRRLNQGGGDIPQPDPQFVGATIGIIQNPAVDQSVKVLIAAGAGDPI